MISKRGEEGEKSLFIDETQQNPLSQESFKNTPRKTKEGHLKMKQMPKELCRQRRGVHSQHWWVLGAGPLTCKPVILLLLLEQTETPSRYLAEAACQAKPACWSTELGWWHADSAGGEKVQGRFHPVCSAQSVFNQTPALLHQTNP